VGALTIAFDTIIVGRFPSDPPYMEFTLVLLTLVGAWLVWTTPLPLQQVERGGAEKERKHYW
jgi:hypothetical protein